MPSSLLENRRVRINVGGLYYETYEKTLQRYPDTLLGDPAKRDQFYDALDEQYFFNCHRNAFDGILFFYQSNGKLLRPSDIPMDVFEEQCRFFDLPDQCISDMKKREGYVELAMHEMKAPTSFCEEVWYTLKYPETSRKAFWYSIISMTAVVIAFAITCIQSFTDFNHIVSVKGSPMYVIDYALSCWFVLELVIKSLFAPKKLAFLRSALTIIDFVASFPYFLMLVLSDKQIPWLSFARLFRLCRLVGILKIIASSTKAELLGKILASSLPDLGLLFICMLMVVFIGASLLFMVESQVPSTQFTSIPESTWWALQTVVVLGYGDMIPTTNAGKAVATVFMLFGVVTMSLPVLSIASKFFVMYGNNM